MWLELLTPWWSGNCWTAKLKILRLRISVDQSGICKSSSEVGLRIHTTAQLNSATFCLLQMNHRCYKSQGDKMTQEMNPGDVAHWDLGNQFLGTSYHRCSKVYIFNVVYYCHLLLFMLGDKRKGKIVNNGHSHLNYGVSIKYYFAIFQYDFKEV